MEMLHQPLYATLVGRVDEAITLLEQMADEQTFDWSHLMQATELLKNALLEAEERYIEQAAEEPDVCLTVRPPL